MMHQRFDDDPGPLWDGYPGDMARNIGAGWDANGSPLPERDTPTHACWICQRRTARTVTGLWFSVYRVFITGKLLVWTCSAVCQDMALALVDGLAGLLDIR